MEILDSEVFDLGNYRWNSHHLGLDFRSNNRRRALKLRLHISITADRMTTKSRNSAMEADKENSHNNNTKNIEQEQQEGHHRTEGPHLVIRRLTRKEKENVPTDLPSAVI